MMWYDVQLCGSYTWKIYANKVLNMGSLYGFWKKVNNKEKLAKQRYLQMFYDLQFETQVSGMERLIIIIVATQL